MDRRLITEARAVRGTLALTIFLSVLSGVFIIVQAAFLSRAINAAFLEDTDLDTIAPILIALALVVLLRALAAWGSTTAAGYTSERVKSRLRERLFAHLLALGPAYAQGERSGELTNTLTEGVEALDAYFREYLPQLVIAVLVPLVILLFVFPLDLLTGLVLLITAPLIPFFMALIGIAAGSLARQQYGLMSRLSAHFLDVMQGLTTLKLFNRSRYQIDTIARMTAQFGDATMKVLRVAFLSALVLEMIATLSIAVVAVEIGLRLLAGGIAFEQALFLLILAPDFYQPLRTLGARFHAGTEGKAAAERIFAVLDTPLPPEIDDPITTLPQRMHIRFDDVHFAYEDGDRPALNGASFEIFAGERVALVGPSGSGKSTIASLILRFIENDFGIISVHDVPLSRIPPDLWREQVAWVPQSPYLINASIADNIRLARPDADQSAVLFAAEQAAAHDFISEMPDSYDTQVGERGARLSGGQAQRIAIARAFLKDAPLLILDEATSNLDPESEALVEAALDRLTQNRTTLVIAHRLTTVYRADRILVLSAGQVIESGTHELLLHNGGIYRDLVTAYT